MDTEEYKAITAEAVEFIEELIADRDRWKAMAEDNMQGMVGQKAIIENLKQEMKKFSCCCDPMCCHRVPEKQLVECKVCGKYVWIHHLDQHIKKYHS